MWISRNAFVRDGKSVPPYLIQDVLEAKFEPCYPELVRKHMKNPWVFRLVQYTYRHNITDRRLTSQIYKMRLLQTGDYPHSDVMMLFFKEESIKIYIFGANRPQKEVELQVDLDTFGFWKSIHWYGSWTDQERTFFALSFLGAQYNQAGNLIPAKGAFGSERCDESEALEYLRSIEELDFNFLVENLHSNELLCEYVQERMGIERNLSPEELSTTCILFAQATSATHPFGIDRAWESCRKMIDSNPDLAIAKGYTTGSIALYDNEIIISSETAFHKEIHYLPGGSVNQACISSKLTFEVNAWNVEGYPLNTVSKRFLTRFLKNMFYRANLIDN